MDKRIEHNWKRAEDKSEGGKEEECAKFERTDGIVGGQAKSWWGH